MTRLLPVTDVEIYFHLDKSSLQVRKSPESCRFALHQLSDLGAVEVEEAIDARYPTLQGCPVNEKIFNMGDGLLRAVAPLLWSAKCVAPCSGALAADASSSLPKLSPE